MKVILIILFNLRTISHIATLMLMIITALEGGAVSLNHSPVRFSSRCDRHGRMPRLSQRQHFAYRFPYIPFMLGGGHSDLFSHLTPLFPNNRNPLFSLAGSYLCLPFVEDKEMAIKWVTAYLFVGPLPFSAGNILQQPCGKYQGGFHSL